MQEMNSQVQLFEEQVVHFYGNLSEAYKARQTVIAWNTIFDPHEGIVTPVSRGWNFGAGSVECVIRHEPELGDLDGVLINICVKPFTVVILKAGQMKPRGDF